MHVLYMYILYTYISYRNVLFFIRTTSVINDVYKSNGSNANVLITQYASSPNGNDHLTSIGTIAIWTVRS